MREGYGTELAIIEPGPISLNSVHVTMHSVQLRAVQPPCVTQWTSSFRSSRLCTTIHGNQCSYHISSRYCKDITYRDPKTCQVICRTTNSIQNSFELRDHALLPFTGFSAIRLPIRQQQKPSMRLLSTSS
jgi:hypothetical protein